MRDTTEWTELVDANVNELVAPQEDKMLDAVTRHFGLDVSASTGLYSEGSAVPSIVAELDRLFGPE